MDMCARWGRGCAETEVEINTEFKPTAAPHWTNVLQQWSHLQYILLKWRLASQLASFTHTTRARGGEKTVQNVTVLFISIHRYIALYLSVSLSLSLSICLSFSHYFDMSALTPESSLNVRFCQFLCTAEAQSLTINIDNKVCLLTCGGQTGNDRSGFLHVSIALI